jgi:hypothetical protein
VLKALLRSLIFQFSFKFCHSPAQSFLVSAASRAAVAAVLDEVHKEDESSKLSTVSDSFPRCLSVRFD